MVQDVMKYSPLWLEFLTVAHEGFLGVLQNSMTLVLIRPTISAFP